MVGLEVPTTISLLLVFGSSFFPAGLVLNGFSTPRRC